MNGGLRVPSNRHSLLANNAIARLIQDSTFVAEMSTQELPLLHTSRLEAVAHGSFSDITALMSALKNDNYFPDMLEGSNGQAH